MPGIAATLLMIFFFLPAAEAKPPCVRHAVFDLDDTLIRWVRPDELHLGDSHMGDIVPKNGSIAGKNAVTHLTDFYRYRVLDGAVEILQTLYNTPGTCVSFFSLGPRDRNIKVLKEMKLLDGKTSAFDIAYKILSHEDATRVGETLYKDMTKVSPDLNNLALFEDHAGSVLPGQENNVVWIGDKPSHYYRSVSEQPLPGAAWKPTTASALVQNRNRLAFGWGVYQEGLRNSRENGGSLPKALFALQWSTRADGKRIYNTELTTNSALYFEGAMDFYRINPHYFFNDPHLQLGFNRCENAEVRKLLISH